VKLFYKGQQNYQEQSPVRGFQSSSDPVLNFGIGKNNSVDSVLVIWPDDNYQKLINVKANQTLVVKVRMQSKDGSTTQSSQLSTSFHTNNIARCSAQGKQF
jgi:hypothetical protein